MVYFNNNKLIKIFECAATQSNFNFLATPKSGTVFLQPCLNLQKSFYHTLSRQSKRNKRQEKKY